MERQAIKKFSEKLLIAFQVDFSFRRDMDPEMLQFLRSTYKRINDYQCEMLILTERLITARLNSFASCVVVSPNKDETEWDYHFGPGSLKRLCKLIEVYNKLLRWEIAWRKPLLAGSASAIPASFKFNVKLLMASGFSCQDVAYRFLFVTIFAFKLGRT